MIWTIAKKELRGYFNSAVALIFLGAFLVGVLYTFFWYEKFFARGLADLRPLFEWMPKLLIILVSALAMRLWAEERSAGTLEILLTLPVPRWKLVAGKFVAGMLLIAIALALTLGIPLTVAHMGNLDIGPVIGGYLAALLLSAAYLVIGMCVSAATSIQIVAFVGTALLCGFTYLLGELGEVGRLFGTGARFESVARGVLDLRDLAYYAGIIVFGFAVNVVLIGRVSWGRSKQAMARRFSLLLTVGLIAANAIALDLWLAPVGRARIDLTQDNAYSLSSSTKRLLGGLDETLHIRGYFSDKTHPDLAPLIPQLRDLLDEYEAAGNGKVDLAVIDPTDDDAAKRNAKELFDIAPQPMEFATASERSVVNAYFSIAIQYGDQHEVLNVMDLIQVRQLDLHKIEVTLRNGEYQITKAIKKAVESFSSMDSLFASTPGPVKLTVYLTPDSLPDNLKDAPAKLKKVTEDLAKEAGGKLQLATVAPKTEDEMLDLYKRYGLRPYQNLAAAMQPGKSGGLGVYYYSVIVELGDKIVRIQMPETVSEAGLKTSIVNGIKRAAPGFTKVVGMWVPQAPPPSPEMAQMGMGRQPPPQTFQQLRQSLAGNYEVRDIQLETRIPDDIDVVLLCGPAHFDDKAAETIDQFVMRGGSLVVLDGRFRLAPAEGLAIEKVTTGLEKLFEAWGIDVNDQLVLDTHSDTFPIPQMRDVGGGMMVREFKQIPYPFFVRVDAEGMSSSIINGGIPGSIMHFAAPVEAKDKVGEDTHDVDVLLRSSDESWLSSSLSVEPDPDKGFPPPVAAQRASHPLAVAITGGFTSFLKGSKDSKQASGQRLIEHSPLDARIVVFGSSVFASDALLNHAEQFDQSLALSNIGLVHNAVDWAFADTDLLAIRGRDATAHALTLEPDKRDNWRVINVLIAVFALAGVIGLAWIRKRAVQPLIGGRGMP